MSLADGVLPQADTDPPVELRIIDMRGEGNTRVLTLTLKHPLLPKPMIARIPFSKVKQIVGHVIVMEGQSEDKLRAGSDRSARP